MSPADRIRALTLAPGLLGVTIIEAAGLTAKTVIAIDAADFISGEAIRRNLISPIRQPSTPTRCRCRSARRDRRTSIAAPTYSAFQQDLVVLRMIRLVLWAMRRTGRVASVASVTW